uniref:Piwi domain-containing protein n=1 Tax=Steinernema glaseri TaxID=37863 RepID=A0A1I7ZC90_9BILA
MNYWSATGPDVCPIFFYRSLLNVRKCLNKTMVTVFLPYSPAPIVYPGAVTSAKKELNYHNSSIIPMGG